MDHGGRFLPKVRAAGSPVLVRNVGPRRICPETSLHLHPDLQAVTCVQAMGVCVVGTFCPPKRVLCEVLGRVSAAVSFLN